MKLSLISLLLLFVSFVSHADAENKRASLNILTSFPPDFYLPFKQAFNQQHPSIKVNFRNKKTTSGIKYLQRQYNHDIDLFWASAPDAFKVLQSSDLLFSLPHLNYNFPEHLHNYPLKEKQNHYVGFALSGYGIMMNKDYLKKNKLSAPKSWMQLTKAEYYSHLALSSPSRSGTTHIMIEMILQRYGWDKGWKIIMQIAGNAATITARSYGVPDGIIQGRFGLGLVIDFFANKVEADNIDFNYSRETQFLPASIALLKSSQHKAEAKVFIEFVLSKTGQTLLQQKNIARLPIDPQQYQLNKNLVNPFALKRDVNEKTFDSKLSTQRYDLVNTLFDHFLTFQLKTLQRLWGKINAAEVKYAENNPSKLATISQLKNKLSTLPINQAVSTEPALYNSMKQIPSSIVSGYLPEPLASYKMNWLQQLNSIELALETL